MRFPLSLLAVYVFIHSIFAQSTPHDIHCQFFYRNGLYACFLNDTTILTETVPLRFFNIHPPNHNDGDVEVIYTSAPWAHEHINIRVFHHQLMTQFPNVQIIEFSDARVEILLNDSFTRCDELIELTLDRNRLSSIPPRVFENCTKLRTLGLNVHFPMLMDGESFFGLHNLEILRIGRLIVSNTIFQYLPRIRRLQLANINGIESNALRRMTQLEIIDISDSAVNLSVIQDAIVGMGSLLRISLNRNRYPSSNFELFGQFDKLEEFEMIGNQLTTIPANSFTNSGNLKSLRLNNNHISQLTEESFAGLHSLETLTLNHNRLNRLPSNAFHDLINLRFLELSNNVIPTIEADTFKGLQSLDTLVISRIQLSNLVPGMFEPLQNLRELRLIENNIANIPPNIFSSLQNLRSLHLDLNWITRLNSNSFGRLLLLDTFFIRHSVWNHGLDVIERNFFDNFPRLVRFGGNGMMCDEHVNNFVNMTLIDFNGETVFDRCFLNWDATITTTGDPNTTPTSGAASGIGKFFVSMILIAIRVIVV